MTSSTLNKADPNILSNYLTERTAILKHEIVNDRASPPRQDLLRAASEGMRMTPEAIRMHSDFTRVSCEVSRSSPDLMRISPVPNNDDINLFPTGFSEDTKCVLNNCLLCSRGVPPVLVQSPTWASIMRVVFYCLQSYYPERDYFNLKTDVYGFMTSHWKNLCLDKKRSDNWHKQIQDMLSHSKNLFESGMDLYKQNGYWRMKQSQDPWTIRKERKLHSQCSSKTLKDLKRSSGDQLEPDSPARKRIKEEESSSDEDEERNLQEEEIRTLREAIGTMKNTLCIAREELRKKDEELAYRAKAYSELLQHVNLLQSKMRVSPVSLVSQTVPQMTHPDLRVTKWEETPYINVSHAPPQPVMSKPVHMFPNQMLTMQPSSFMHRLHLINNASLSSSAPMPSVNHMHNKHQTMPTAMNSSTSTLDESLSRHHISGPDNVMRLSPLLIVDN